MSLPDARTWHRHCRLLERRARVERDPTTSARLHHQRGWILQAWLNDPAGAIRAWQAGLSRWPSHLPSLIALRDIALATDDAELARQLFDGHVDALNRPGIDPRDTAEMYTWFAATWTFRWPDDARASAAVRHLDVIDPEGEGDLLAPLCLNVDAQRVRLARRLTAGLTDAARPLADLNQTEARAGRLDIQSWLAMAAPNDPFAALRWVEEATAMDDPRGQAEALEALAAHCDFHAPVLRFLAGEIWELILDDPARATTAFNAASDVALDQVLVIKEGIRRTRSAGGPVALAEVLAAQSERLLGDPLFAACVQVRAAALYLEAGETETAWALAGSALQRAPTLDAAAQLVLRLGKTTQRWRATADALALVSTPRWCRVRAALLEHAIGDAAGAEAALGTQIEHLGGLRAQQRLLTATDDAGLGRAWQRETALLASSERRAELYLRIGAFYLGQGALDKALTYLLWVLDHDTDHLTALRLAVASTQSAGRRGPMIEVAGRLLTLTDDPADRLPLQRLLATALAEDHPDRAAAILDQVLAVHPDDRGSIALLEQIYQRLGDARALAGLYERALRRPSLSASERSAVALRFGRLLEGPLRDDRAALAVYAEAAAQLDPQDDRRPAFDDAVERLSLGQTGGSIATLARDGQTSPTRPVGDDEYAGLMPSDIKTGAFESNLPTVDPLDHLLADALDSIEAPAEPTQVDPHGPAPDAPGFDLPHLDLPQLAPLPPMTRRGSMPDANGALLSPIGTREVTPISRPDALAEAQQTAEARFLGTERSRDRALDPARAIIAAKLKRARREEPWPDRGDPALIEQIDRYERASDPDGRFRAAAAMGARYAELDAWGLAIRAFRAARGYRANDPDVETRLEAAFRAQGDWSGLADLLSGRARQSGDPERQQALFLELARLRMAELDDPNGAVDDFKAAIEAGARSTTVHAELANALKAVRRWPEFVQVLADAGLARPDAVGPLDALTLGQVFLYHLDAPERAAPFLLRAARALPDRVDVAADLAEARAAAGDPSGAARLLEHAIAAAPGDDGREARQVLRLRLARLYQVHGADPELARRAYREALRDGVRDAAVLEQVERLAVDAQDWVTLAEVLRASFATAVEQKDPTIKSIGVRLGKLLRDRLHHPDEATEVLLTAYENAPEDGALFRVVESSVSQKATPAQVIRLYRTWIAHTPLRPNDRLVAGIRLLQAHESQGELKEAGAELSVLAELAPADAAVQAAMERIYPRIGRWPALVQLYRDDLAVVPEDQRTALLSKLAYALEIGTRDLPAATNAWRAVLARSPDDLNVVRALARLLEAQRRFGELLPVSQREIALTQDARAKAYIHFRMGSIHETHLEDLEAAAAAYRQALKLDPRCFPALHGLRTLAWERKDYKGVLGLLRREYRLWDAAREQAAVLARMGEVFATRLGDSLEAQRCFEQAIELWPACVPAARALADAAFIEGRYADAAPRLQLLSTQKLDSWPRAERAELFYRRGACALALGRRLEAIESLALALEFSVDHLPALDALVRAAGEDPAWADQIQALLTAAATARMAAGDTAGRAKAESLRGDLLFAQLDVDAALTAWRRAADLRPDDLEARRPLIRAFVLLRRWPDATAELARFAEGLRPHVTDSPSLARRYTDALQWEGDIWCDFAGEPGRAIATYRRVLQVAPDARDVLYRMAQAYVLMSDFEEARTVLRSALPQPGEATEATEYAEHVFYLGRIHALGFQDDRGAAELYQRALQIDPACSMAMLALTRLLDRHNRGATADKLLDRCAAHIEADPGADRVRAILRLYVARRRIAAGDVDGGRMLLTPMAEGDGPLARDARFALVEHDVATGDLDGAVERLYTLLDADVTDIEALRRLVDLVPDDDDERRWQVLSVLELLDALSPAQQADFDALAVRARQAVSHSARALPDDALQRVLHPSLASPLVELAALCEVALEQRFTLGPRPTLPRGAAVTGKRHDFLPDLREVEAILGTRAEVAVTDSPDAHRIWPGAPAMIVLGDGSHQHRRVWVAQALGALRLGLGRLYALDTPRALELLGVVSVLLAPDSAAGATPGTDDGPVQRTLVDALPPRTAERVKAVIADVGGAALPARLTGEALLDGLIRTMDRLGLLAAGRLRLTIEAIAPSRHTHARPVRGDLPWRLRTGSGAQALARLQDLVKYALSDAYREARRASGVTL